MFVRRGAARVRPNQALKLTRLSGCLLRGPGFGEDPAVPTSCTSPAVQLSAGDVRSLYFRDPEGNSLEFVCYDESVR